MAARERDIAAVVTLYPWGARKVDATMDVTTNDSGETILEEVDAQEDSNMEANDPK